MTPEERATLIFDAGLRFMQTSDIDNRLIAAFKNVRSEALEEAAKVASGMWGSSIAKEIRALKEK